jgi:MYXO-CTERM domain-containing protein
MRRSLRWSLLVLVAGLGFTQTSFGAQVTETFTGNTDLYWDSLNNRADPQNYGWSATDNTGITPNPPGGTATPAGELGGDIHRPPIPAPPSTDPPTPTYYGFNVGAIDPATEGFSVSGVMRSERRDGAVFFGYFAGAGSFPDAGKNAHNFIGVLLNDGGAEVFTQIYNPGGSREGGAVPTPVPTDGTVVPFSMTYQPPPAGTGNGSLSFTVGSNSGTTNLPNTIVQSIDDLSHFGFFPQVRDAGPSTSFSRLFFDDLTFTSDNPIPEPASLGLLGVAALALRRVRRRA